MGNKSAAERVKTREPTDGEINARQAAKDARVAARQAARRSDAEVLAATRVEAQVVHNDANAADAAIPPTVDVVLLNPGEAVMSPDNTAVSDVVATVAVLVGAPVTATVTVAPDLMDATAVGYLGVQWVNADNSLGAISWTGGTGVLSVTAVAPDTAVGARYVLAVYDDPGNHVAEPDLYSQLVSLQAWRDAQGVTP